jgi:hypothetical protein
MSQFCPRQGPMSGSPPFSLTLRIGATPQGRRPANDPPTTRSSGKKPPKIRISCQNPRRDAEPNLIQDPLFTGGSLMELGGLEPPTSWVRSRRSPN